MFDVNRPTFDNVFCGSLMSPIVDISKKSSEVDEALYILNCLVWPGADVSDTEWQDRPLKVACQPAKIYPLIFALPRSWLNIFEWILQMAYIIPLRTRARFWRSFSIGVQKTAFCLQ